MSRLAPALGLLALAVAAPALGQGAGWRGDGTGRYPAADPPLKWDIDAGTAIRWAVTVGKGQSTPVVSGGRIFLAVEQDLLLCLDRETGKVLWQKDNGYGVLPAGTPPPAKRPPAAPGCGYATPTPVTDGKYVYASYGTGIVVCYDYDGNRRWARWLDRPQASEYGRAASPLLVKGKLLVSVGGLEALDPASGEILWEAKDAVPTFGTPAAARIGDVDVVLTPGGDCVRLADGRLLASNLAVMKYTTPLVEGGVVYYAGAPTVALRLPEAAGETVRPAPLWQAEDLEGEFFASPLCHDGIIYVASNLGVLDALDAKTGALVFRQKLPIASADVSDGREPANVYGSLVLAGKHLFLANDAGETLVLEPGRQYKEVAHNFLDKGSGATLVPDGKRLFLRGGRKLYCIGQE